MENRCVCCGAIIPEGRQVCPKCEKEGGCGAVVGNPAGNPDCRVDHMDNVRRWKREQRADRHKQDQ